MCETVFIPLSSAASLRWNLHGGEGSDKAVPSFVF